MIVQAIHDFTPELLKQCTGIDIYAPKVSKVVQPDIQETPDSDAKNLEQPTVYLLKNFT